MKTEYFITEKNLHKVSFLEAHLLVKQRKLFTNGELIKLYLIAVAKKKKVSRENNLHRTISLLVLLRVEDTGKNISCQLESKANDFKWFSLALDELTYVDNTIQLLFIHKVNDKFKVTQSHHE